MTEIKRIDTWSYTEECAATTLEIAKSIYNKFDGAAELFAQEIYDIEAIAIEYLCGTENAVIDKYLFGFYNGIISVKDLIGEITYPKENETHEYFRLLKEGGDVE